MKNVATRMAASVIMTLVLLAQGETGWADDLGRAFTYQGKLEEGGQPVNGAVNLVFKLFDAVSGGTQIGPTLTHNGVVVAEGLLTRELDFAGAAIDGRALWLEIAVNGTILTPRQKLTSAPSALTLAPGAEIRGTSQQYALQVTNLSAQHNAMGVYAQSISESGRALFGHVTHTAGINWGVYGSTASTSGVAVNGTAIASTGTPYGVRGEVLSPDGFAGFFVGGRNFFDGHVGFGTLDPAWPIDVSANQAVGRFVSTSTQNGSVIDLRNQTAGADYLGAINFSTSSAVPGQIGYHDNGNFVDTLTFRVGGLQPILLYPTELCVFGAVNAQGSGLGQASSFQNIDVAAVSISRDGTDGSVVDIWNDSMQAGSISVSGGTVSYNAFTGSHYGWTDSNIERGALVRMTGVNRRLHSDADSEMVYGITSAAGANDPSCLGAYLGLQESAQPHSAGNPHLVMAVGNGEMWVAESSAGDIRPGDYLVSSDVSGCAMKDDPQRFPIGYIVARAAEGVEWSTVPSVEGQPRRVKISVLFENFMRNSRADELAHEVETLKSQVQSLQDACARLEGLVQQTVSRELATREHEE